MLCFWLIDPRVLALVLVNKMRWKYLCQKRCVTLCKRMIKPNLPFTSSYQNQKVSMKLNTTLSIPLMNCPLKQHRWNKNIRNHLLSTWKESRQACLHFVRLFTLALSYLCLNPTSTPTTTISKNLKHPNSYKSKPKSNTKNTGSKLSNQNQWTKQDSTPSSFYGATTSNTFNGIN